MTYTRGGQIWTLITPETCSLLHAILQKDFIKAQIGGTKNATGAGADSFAVIASTSAYKSQQFESEKLFSEQDAAKSVGDWYGDLVSKLTHYAQKYPELTTALSGATTAITALGTGAYTIGGLLAAWKILYGRPPPPPPAPSGINPPPVPPGTTVPPNVPGVRLPPWLSGLARFAGKALVPLSVYQATQDAPLVQVERGDNEARQRLSMNQYANDTERLQDTMRAQPGALDAWDDIKAWWSKPTSIGNGLPPAVLGLPDVMRSTPAPAPPQQSERPIQATLRLEVDGRVLAETVNEFNGQQATRGSNGAYQ